MLAGVASWVASTFGPVAETVFEVSHLSTVTGIRLFDGRVIVVKARAGVVRARTCVAGQAALHEDGFPCPAPLCEVVDIDGLAVHAEEYIDAAAPYVVEGTASHADLLASLLADLVSRADRLALSPPTPATMWLAWDHDGSGAWPRLHESPPLPEAMESVGWLTEVAERVRRRLRFPAGDLVVAHGDWEAQNMAQRDDGSLVVHDWDSLVHRPEPAIVGAAAATFASGREQP